MMTITFLLVLLLGAIVLGFAAGIAYSLIRLLFRCLKNA